MTKRKPEAVAISAESLKLDTPAANWVDSSKAVRAEINAKPDDEAPEPEHVDIGNWEATHWRGRPIWRHKRTGQTLHNRAEVRRQRNLK